MATDFFERQSRARTNTAWLVALFIIAVIALVGLSVGVTVAAIRWYGDELSEGPLEWQIPLGVGLGTLAVIVGGSLFKVIALRRGGGSGVAESLGGNRLFPNATDSGHRQLLNVVEEMAIASGTPVPPVFLLNQEQGINAFAAGYSPDDAVLGITRGCVETLSRDELQGVVAHEFSHIHNGDMRLGIRLIGVLHGILLIGLVGREVFRLLVYGGAGWDGRRSRSDNKKEGGGGGILVLIAVAATMVVIGAVGVFFGSLIRAAVSRQREYLADASAVQFTRNPGGLSGALKKIGGMTRGSKLKSVRAPEASHLFFAQGVAEGFTSWMSTHPPLDARIRAIEPSWDGDFPRLESPAESTPADSKRPTAAAVSLQSAAQPLASLSAVAVQDSVSHIGSPGEEHRRYASELLSRLPQKMLAAVHEPYEARAVVFAMLLDRDAELRRHQLASLGRMMPSDVVQGTQRWFEEIGRLEPRVRLPLVDLSLPALRAMTHAQYREFSHGVQELIAADSRLNLFEWTLSQVLRRHLRGQFEPLPSTRFDYYALGRLGEPLSVLLSMLAHVGHSEEESKRAFALGAERVAEAQPEWLPKSQCTLDRLDASLQTLATVTGRHRQRIVDACSVCVCADGQVTASEAETLRGVADLLDCPMPPYLVAPEITSPAPASSSVEVL